jgi:hypothetical protein
MTCYFRHLKQIFAKADIEVTPQNKKQLDEIIHNLVKTTYKDCPTTWKEVKKRISENEDVFIQKLISAWNDRQA